MGAIVQFAPKDPGPLSQSGSSFISDNGEIQAQFTKDDQGNNVVQFTDLGRNTSVSWLPQEIKYIDDNGMEDIIVAADQSSDLFVVRNFHARYDRHFPDVEEYWRVEAGQIKHHMTITGDQRAPLPFLVNPKLAIGGILEFDPSFSVRTMGVIMSGDFDTGSAIEIVDLNGNTVFTLPAVEVWDQAQNTTAGSYHVEQLGPGRIYVATCVDNGWVEGDDIVYPVVIDPTVIVSSPYSTYYHPGGQTLTVLSNGWIVAALGTGDYVYFYVSKDGGNTFQQLTYTSTGGTGTEMWAIDSTGTIVVLVWGQSTTQFTSVYESLTFDATVVTNTDQKSNMVVIPGPNNNYLYEIIGGVSVGIDSSNNVFVVYTAIPTSGGVTTVYKAVGTLNGTTITWGTSALMLGEASVTHPMTVIASNNKVYIVWVYNYQNSSYRLEYAEGTATGGFSSTYIYGASSTLSDYPFILMDSNGYLHLFWSSGAAIMHSYSTNPTSGIFTTPETVYTVPSGTVQNGPTVAYDSKDNKFYMFFSYGSGTYTLAMISGATGAWSTPTTITTGSVAQCPVAVSTPGAIMFMYKLPSSVDFGTINLYTAPNAPSLGTVSNFDATTSQTFPWTFSPSTPGDTQSAFELQIYDVAAGKTVFDTGKVVGSGHSYTLPPNTLTNGKQYQWRVMTWENGDGLQGPYSAYSTFTCAEAPTAVLTYPTANMTDVTASITAQWAYSDPYGYTQASYDLQLLDENGNVLWGSGVVSDPNGTIRQMTVGYVLQNNTSYQLSITATNSQGLTSSPVTVAFSTSFTPPAPATTTVTSDSEHARIVIDIVNPAPSGTQPDVSYNDIYRRNYGDSAWQRIATQISVNGSYHDYAVASGQSYDYKVTACGANGAQIDSQVVTTPGVVLTGLWIHDVANPAGTIMNLLYFNNSNSSTDGTTPNTAVYTPNAEAIQVAGRALPVNEFGENYTFQLTKGAVTMFADEGQWPVLENLLRNEQTTLCVRDGRGRMIFGNTLNGYTVTDLIFGYQVDIVLSQNSYSFAV
ncbi:hypothetical protein ACOALA_04120 [Alicyclobacillus acidoterrestris]|uniref:glycoside hydrolase family 78 protein n=1 Tax=Alicyclobacillus acidoterrestris TaxID=1450 RepID=UPI003F530E8B